ARQRIQDIERRRGRVHLHRQSLDPALERPEGVGERPTCPHQLGGGRVGEMAAPIIAAIVVTSTSRFLMWASSWASTPRTCSRGMMASSPSVTATAEWRGLRPVAKAFGCLD